MRPHVRAIGALVPVLLAAAVAHAESPGSPGKGPSTRQRLAAATAIVPTPKGLVALGGPTLRVLRPGAGRWETLHTVPNHQSYRVVGDHAGRLLAAWEREPLVHLFGPDGKLEVSLAKPAAPADVRGFEVTHLELAANGRDAIVFMVGDVQVVPGRFGASGRSTSAYRVALDGRTPARLLFRVDHAHRLHMSARGGVFAKNKHPGRSCDHGGCLMSELVAYEITDDGARARTLLGGPGFAPNRARLLRGSDEERAAVLLDSSQPQRQEVVRWRYGDARAEVLALPVPATDDRTQLYFTKAGEVIELRPFEERSTARLEVFRHGSNGPVQLASLRALQTVDLRVRAFGERASGSLWVHWGDHLALLSQGQPARAYDLGPLLPRKGEWAGDLYVSGPPEHWWVGLDGRGRDYVRLDGVDLEKRATAWPPYVPPDAAAVRAAADPKDASTSQRLYDADGIQAYPGGLVTTGFRALRRLRHGASKWERLHFVPDDNLYRIAVDETGRVLAAWEKDPSIHVFSPQNQRVAFPKPTMPAGVKLDFRVEDLAFSPDGRDALVFMEGRLDMGTRDMVAVYRIALDGPSEPRLVFRADDVVVLHASSSGMVLAHPQDPGRQTCSHQTCWPMGAIVVYEIAGDRVTPRTLLDGRSVNVSSAQIVPGSDDRHVGILVELARLEGTRPRFGGRAVLRWRRGDERADYRALPGPGSREPRWVLTRATELIELEERRDGNAALLDIHRHPLGGGPAQTSSVRLPEPGHPTHGIGERAGGGLWVHWGESLVLVTPGQPTRAFDLDPLFQRGSEWAGAAVYVKAPEALWIGLDGRGRSFSRVDFADAERRAKAWR